MKRRNAIVVLVLLNVLACAAFVLFRPAGIPFLAERERMRRNPGDMFLISGDAYMFVANRPLRQWEDWHG